jgi:hypothetical protein
MRDWMNSNSIERSFSKSRKIQGNQCQRNLIRSGGCVMAPIPVEWLAETTKKSEQEIVNVSKANPISVSEELTEKGVLIGAPKEGKNYE